MNNKNKSLKSFNDTIQLDQNVELLNQFATYVYMTKQDYKYNETYLKDMIPGFWSNIERYNQRISFRKDLQKKIQKIHMPEDKKYQLIITIDETWKLEFKNSPNENIRGWEKAISERPKFNAVDEKKIYVQCRFSYEQDISFTDYMVSDKQENLKEFVIKSIEGFVKKMGEQTSGRDNKEQ